MTETELRQMLRASLDREAALNDRLDAAAEHVKSLESELLVAKAARDADAAKITNLQSQVDTAAREAATLREAIENYKASIEALKQAVALRDAEVARQKEKVKAANKRSVWAAVGGVVVTVVTLALLKR